MGDYPAHDPSRGRSYNPVDVNNINFIEIFPPVAFARVGNADTEYYYGPEVPGVEDVPPGFKFHTADQRIKRQAVRFRAYAYDSAGKMLGEINTANGYQLKWTVHVANKKAAATVFKGRHQNKTNEPRNPKVQGDLDIERRTRLIVDPGEKTIEKATQNVPAVKLEGKFQGSGLKSVEVYLGELRVDEVGRLIFLGGKGRSIANQGGSGHQPKVISEFNGVDWIDDICDGWVNLEVRKGDRSFRCRHKATVGSGPPKFVWGMNSPTTLYDIMENIYSLDFLPTTEFYRDIWPVLRGTCNISWVNEKADQGHGRGTLGYFLDLEEKLKDPSVQNKPLREHVFNKLREPDFANMDQAHTRYMPRLSGDGGDALKPGEFRNESLEPIKRFAALTRLQYMHFEQWKNGSFTVEIPKPSPKNAIEDYRKEDQPEMLTRAILEQSIGDPIYPGIEVGWIAKLQEIYIIKRPSPACWPPFRINHDVMKPGYLTRNLSLPWQSDFSLCDIHWWPTIRPDDVITRNGTRMKWTRKLDNTPTDFDTNFYPGSTDMIKNWQNLKFVVKLNGEDKWQEEDD